MNPLLLLVSAAGLLLLASQASAQEETIVQVVSGKKYRMTIRTSADVGDADVIAAFKLGNDTATLIPDNDPNLTVIEFVASDTKSVPLGSELYIEKNPNASVVIQDVQEVTATGTVPVVRTKVKTPAAPAVPSVPSVTPQGGMVVSRNGISYTVTDGPVSGQTTVTRTTPPMVQTIYSQSGIVAQAPLGDAPYSDAAILDAQKRLLLDVNAAPVMFNVNPNASRPPKTGGEGYWASPY
jgi:hypothetical protein